MVTKDTIKILMPSARTDLVEAVINNWSMAERAGINTPARIRFFMATIAVETGGLRAIEENMNYTTTAQLRKTWPSRFKSDAAAKPLVRNPQKLAIMVYGGRMGNASTPSPDGWDYRGGGMLQTTGRDGYARMGFESNPERLRTPLYAFSTAVREWASRRCNSFADAGDVEGCRRAINGGLNGIAEFKTYLARAKTIWKDGEVVQAIAFTDATTVMVAQKRLLELGYSEVGRGDGKMGAMTRAAILAFRDDNNLPLKPVIDTELLEALTDAAPRQLDDSRSMASLADVRAVIPEAKVSYQNRVVSAITAGTSAVVAAASGVIDNLPGADPIVDMFKKYVVNAPTWFWFVLIAAVALFLWFRNRSAEKSIQDAYQKGERR